VLAQTPATGPRIGYLFPAGGQRNTAFEVVAGGQFLNGVTGAFVTGGGVEAQVLEHKRPLTPNQINALREQYRELTERKAAGKPPWTASDEQKLADLRKQLASIVRRPANPAIAETVRVRITLAPEAVPGERELRLRTPAGLTNPLKFVIGTETENAEPHGSANKSVQDVRLPVVLNGQILPGAVDRYRFELSRGQRLCAATMARELIPYISDAVPGWFQAALTLYDPSGKEVAAASSNQFRPDPLLKYEAREGGSYQLEVRDSIFRGREDFVYRIALGPPPAAATAAKSKDKAEREPNNDAGHAQAFKIPFIAGGQMNSAGDVDVYRFNGRAGEQIVAEVAARRIDSPMDSSLRLTDASGNEVASNDDFEDKANGLLTHHADSRIEARLPKSGAYYLHVSDTQRQAGPDIAYRLRVARPQPDFELRVTPASVNITGGMHAPVTVYALRREGFNGEIRLALKDAPEGFALSGGRIPPGVEKVRLTLTAPASFAGRVFRLQLEGQASVAGRQWRRAAIPAEDMMQAFAYWHLVPAQEWAATVIGQNRPRPSWTLPSVEPVRIPTGGTTGLRIAAPLGRNSSEIRLALNQPPEGFSIESVSPSGNGLAVVLKTDTSLKAGLAGNLIIDAYFERTGDNKQVRRVPIGTLPAVPFEIVRQ
jgi:hypothetical protein